MPTKVPPGPIPTEALRYLEQKRLEPGFSFRDVWAEEHAHAFTVAKLMNEDLLNDMKAELEIALELGQPLTDFERRITPLLQKHGWWGEREVTDPITGETFGGKLGSPARLQRIYETNMRSARAVGQWQRIERTKDVRPFLLYSLGPSRVHRDQHVRWEGLILPVDHPFWQIAMPPNGYGCKCRVRQITAAEAESRGGQSADPDMSMISAENPRTGATTFTIPGVDPSFAFNPGQVARGGGL